MNRFVIALSVMLVPSAFAQQVGPASWELKGLKLDMSLDEIKAKFPASECKTHAPGIEMCIDKTATFAGGSAHLVTKFLDGQLIDITLNRISIEQTENAAQGLVAKFGTPHQNVTRRKYIESTGKNQMVTFLTWQVGDVALDVDPMDQFVSKTKTNYGAVSLMYRAKHNSVWLPRARGDADVASDI